MFKRPCLVAAFLTFCCLPLKGQTFTDKLKDYQALVKTYGPVACQKDNPADTEALRSARAKAAKDAMEVLKTSDQQLKSLIDARLKELQGRGLTESELARLSQFYQGQEEQLANPCAATPSPGTNQLAPAAPPEKASPRSQSATAATQPVIASAVSGKQQAPTGAGAGHRVSSAPGSEAPGAQAPQTSRAPKTGAPQARTQTPKEHQSAQGSQAPSGASVSSGSQAGKSYICDNQAHVPCIDQPLEGSTKVTGKATPGSTVKVLLNDKTAGQPQTVSNNGKFKIDIDTEQGLNRYNQVKVVQVEGSTETPAGPVNVAPATKPPSETGASGLYMLGMAGIDITSTTTSGPQQQFFTEFDLTAPISIKRMSQGRKRKRVDPLRSRAWVWFNPRIASVPTPKTAVLSSLATSNVGLPAFGNMSLGDITQSLEFRGGLEFPLITPRDGILFGTDRKSTMSLSLLLGLGAVTPFNAATGAREFDLASSTTPCDAASPTGKMCGDVTNAWDQFKNSEALQNQYPELYNALKSGCAQPPDGSDLLTKCPLLHTAFVLPERSRFLRSYYGGLRLRTFLFKNKDRSHECTAEKLRSKESLDYCVPRNVFPGTFDLTFGQDETVTGGKLIGTVMTVAANYPFPHLPWLRIFGQANLRLAHNRISEPLTLPPAMTFVPLTDPSLIIQNVQPRDQDYFRIGFGVDLTKAFGALRGEAAKAPAAMLTPAGNVSFESDKAQKTITVTNIGGSPLKIDSVTKAGANPDDFVITEPNPCKEKSLDRAKGCTITVTFKPKDVKTPGSRSATLSIKDNAPDQPQIITLTGTVTVTATAKKPKSN